LLYDAYYEELENFATDQTRGMLGMAGAAGAVSSRSNSSNSANSSNGPNPSPVPAPVSLHAAKKSGMAASSGTAKRKFLVLCF
jgi:hypothetical protein